MSRKNLELDVNEFAQAIGLLVRRARAAATSEDLSWTESAVLKRLAREGPATTAELARSQGMKPQSMRSFVAALEGMGMVQRKPHETDGRQVNIELTAKGAALEKHVTEVKRNWLAQAVGRLDKRERKTLFEAGAIIRRLVESTPQ